MPAIEISVLVEPITDALSTSDGVIGLLIGLLGREGLRRVYSVYQLVRTRRQPDQSD